jgi:hypothetical protein
LNRLCGTLIKDADSWRLFAMFPFLP